MDYIKRIKDRMTQAEIDEALILAMESDQKEIGRLRAENESVRRKLDSSPVAIMDTRDVLGICAPTEEDFPALYAIQGKRVRLVVEDDPATKLQGD